MAGKDHGMGGKGWHSSPNEINAAWCDILEYEIAYVCAGEVGRTFADGKVSYDMSAISKAKVKYKASTPRGKMTEKKRAIKHTVNPISGVQTFSVVINKANGSRKGGTVPKQAQIEAYFNAALTNRLKAIGALQKGAPGNVCMSAGTSAHTDVCFIVGDATQGTITDWYSYHAKHDVAPGGRNIGLSNPEGYSVFWNSQWDSSAAAQQKSADIEAKYEAWHANYTAKNSVSQFLDSNGVETTLTDAQQEAFEEDGTLPSGITINDAYEIGDWHDMDAGYWIEKFNADAAFRESFVEYIFARMVQLKATVIKSEFNGRNKKGAPEADREKLLSGNNEITISPWSVAPYANNLWDMTGKNVRAAAVEGSLKQVMIQCEMPVTTAGDKESAGSSSTEWVDAFALAFRQDPIKRSEIKVEANPEARAEMDAAVTERVGPQIDRESIGDYWRHEDIPDKVEKRGKQVDNPRKAPEELLGRLEGGIVTDGELTALSGKEYDFIAEEGELGWSLITKQGRENAAGEKSDIEYYVYISDVTYDEAKTDEAKAEQRMLETIPSEKVSRVGQLGAATSNPDKIVDMYIPKGVVMTEKFKSIIGRCLTEVLLLEEIDPDAMEDFMSLSFDDFLAIEPDEEGEPAGDESYEADETLTENRWMKLAGLLKD